MKRIVKYRVWDIENDRFTRFVYDSHYRSCSLSIHLSGGLVAVDQYGDEIEIDDSKYVIQQYTELNDDKNKEIYEGDIIKVNHLTQMKEHDMSDIYKK